MTRTGFERMADALRTTKASAVTVASVCDVLALENPRFDRDLFAIRAYGSPLPGPQVSLWSEVRPESFPQPIA